MEGDSKYEEPYREVFLFINSSSGGGLGKEMIDRQVSPSLCSSKSFPSKSPGPSS